MVKVAESDTEPPALIVVADKVVEMIGLALFTVTAKWSEGLPVPLHVPVIV